MPGPTSGVEASILSRREDVALRLIAFPHAGGTHSIFSGWPADLPDDVELVSFSLPGRGTRRHVAPYRQWQPMVSDLLAMLDGIDDGTPFAFFGHSFGALTAFEVCRQLRQAGRRQPEILFLSAHRAPHVPAGENRHTLDDDDFVELVRAWGLVPDDLLADRDLLRLVLPPLRADLQLDETYPCRTGGDTGERLEVACVVYGGAQDRTVDLADLHAWREHVADTAPYTVETFPGGHFYTVSAQRALLASVSRHLDQVRTRVGPSIVMADRGYQPHAAGSLWDRFQAQVAATPEALALVDEPRTWTYRELDRDATAVAASIVACGLDKGDVVGLLLPHSAEYCLALLGCFGLGTPACLLDKNWPASLLAQFLDSAGVRAVVTTAELAGLLPDAYQAPERLVLLGGTSPTDPFTRADQGPAAAPARQVSFPYVDPADTALISMTSGTSGTPKAVVNSHLGCLYCFDARYALYPYQESSREGLNVFFAWECLRPLLVGKPAVVIPDAHIVDPVRLVRTVADHGVTRLVVTPSLLESVLDHQTAGPSLADQLHHLELVFLMGEVVPTRVVDKAAALLPGHVRLVNAYSTWESLDVSYADLLPRPTDDAARPVRPSAYAPVGRVLDGSAAVLLGDDGRPVPYGGVGELHVAGPGVAVGYLNDPEKTAQRFVPCPPALAGSSFAGATFYRTGDRARLLPEGALEILGRVGDVVKIRGFKVSLRAVEHVLSGQPGVSRVVVRPMTDTHTGQPNGLVAYVVGDDGAPSRTTLARLRQRARNDLPEYARPRRVIGLDALPISRGSSRKLDLSALPAPDDTTTAIDTTTAALDDTAFDAVAGSGGSAGPEPAGPAAMMRQRLAAAWQEVLGIPPPAPDDNFFDVGGDSLSAARLSGLLAQRYGISLPVIEVFQFSTLRAMAARCSGTAAPVATPVGQPRRSGPAAPTTKVAIVGMSGRFPGAKTIDEFWANLTMGVDSLTVYPTDRLRDKNVPDGALDHPQWVGVGQVIDDVDAFDAEFWGIGQREALLMDPQHRVFIEVAWGALEQAGYARRDNPYRHRTGVFAACGIDGYLVHHLQGGGLTQPLDPAGLFLTEIGNEKDYIATRVAYLLDLGGPAVTVTSACSSGLVAVASAAQSIMTGQCEMAIAGASSINFPNFGYRYEEGLVGSIDGRVRPFDADASGTLFGDAVGAVVLKRLDDAIADGDHVWAVLTGFGVSNDGRMKAGYTAPSASAQARCISDAMSMAGVTAEQISYVECHATATHVGDAIELAGLREAFDRHRDGAGPTTGSCAIGSVKGNIGHANCAAGITGLIKAVLCLHHRALVPTVNYATLNPKLVDLVDCDGSPFVVQESYGDWTVSDPATQLPRRAGVSSFGIGGTNAHVILEEAAPHETASQGSPGTGERRPSPGTPHLLTVSGADERAARRNAARLTRFLTTLPADEVGPAIDVARLTRPAHAVRASAVVTAESVSGADSVRLDARLLAGLGRPARAGTVAFCFPGQGSQVAGMARGLYRGRVDGGRFRRHFDAACRGLARNLPADPAEAILGADDQTVRRPMITQCGLFAVEYALAATLVDIGVRPVAVAGHSVGEYAAAVLAGVLTLDEATRLVAARAQATEALPGADAADSALGGMLSVVGDEQRLHDWLVARSGLWLAVVNAPGRVVLSGTPAALRRALEDLPTLGFTCRPVPVSHPFHSDLLAPVAERLRTAAADIPARPAAIPMASNLTGTWLDAAYQPARYWGDHAVSTVRWRDNVETLLKWTPDVLVEVGPGGVLTTLARKCLEPRDGAGDGRGPVSEPVSLLHDPRDPHRDDGEILLAAIGQLWCHGVDVDFRALRATGSGSPARSVVRHRLPTYEFERTRYWTRPEASIYVGGVVAAGPGSVGDASPVVEPAGTAEGADTDGTAAAARIVRFVTRPAATVTLYCFPYAGGGSTAFQSWAHAAPTWLDIVAVDLPGRPASPAADDADLPAADDADVRMLARLAAGIRADAGDRAVAFCGMSFGASLVLDLLGGPLADWAHARRVSLLCLVGRAPIVPGVDVGDEPVDSYLMAPEEIRDNPQWTRSVLPVLRADLAADARAELRIRRRQAAHGAALVDAPVQVHCGTRDPSLAAGSARDWAAITTNVITDVRCHDGAHDFMVRERAGILDGIVSLIERLDPILGGADDRAVDLCAEVNWVPVASPSAVAPTVATRCLDVWAGTTTDGVRFVRDTLTAPDARVALLCRSAPGRTLVQHATRLLDLLRAVADAEVRGRLVVVVPADAASGIVSGLTRSLAQEEPGLTVQRIHVDTWPADGVGDRPADGVAVPDGSAAGTGQDLLSRILRLAAAHPEEDDLLYRGGLLFAQRLQSVAVPRLPAGTLGATTGRYLLTGGTGGLGRVVTDWLIQHQGVPPERIVVSGRADRGDLRPGIRFVELDLAAPIDPAAVAAVTGPLDGVFHLAGTLDDGVVRNLTGERLAGVLAPKLALSQLVDVGRVAGAGWVVAFSSTSGLLGVPGQANYAAANAWMDTYAMWSTPSGGPHVVTIAWGSWAAAGMAARSAKAVEAARVSGETPVRTSVGLTLLGGVLAATLAGGATRRNLVVCDIEWPRSPWARLPLISAVADARRIAGRRFSGDRFPAEGTTTTAERSAAGPEPVDGTDDVRAFLSRYVHRWDESKRLTELGLDSLDFARIRGDFASSFGAEVPLAVIAKPDQRLGDLHGVLAGYQPDRTNR
ncbi:AMP-binding protein [Solwaraspora sp. WMMD406]|uniref:type I polyketide synthase n=1 Tax=Solwaraspora sp. WMMD406 TaxID=3016095 RepID=UPI002417C13E|nr:type I polyketide synthase [Solwaraspora sp. WMMD406]MDG4767695.1 AMP-binding protein [Solwaraspora sp. WMMD406]